MQLSRRTKWILLGVMAAAVLACGVVLAAVLLNAREEGGIPLKPQQLSVSSSSSSSSGPQDEVWPKASIPERDPNYNPPRPSWLTADLTEIDPIPGKVAYLTFDDGPSSMTPQVLDVLRKKGATATFFTVHNADPSCRNYYKEVVDSGCELALHAYEHNLPKIYKSPETYLSDYNAMNDFLFEVAGVRTKQVRFPGGSSQTMTNRSVFWQVMKAAQKEGLIWHDWNVSSGDASPNRHTSEWIYNNIFPAALQYDNPVILMHDVPRNTYTLEALPWIIDTLRANGYRLDVVSNLKNPVQHKNPDRDTPPVSSGGSNRPSGGSSVSDPSPSRSSELSAPSGGQSTPSGSSSGSLPSSSSSSESSSQSSSGSSSSSSEVSSGSSTDSSSESDIP